MTPEEKAKRYDEAFERVKELLSRCRDNRDRRNMVYRVNDIESIFPELKKSEDEKIKEDLIEWISDFPDMIWSGHYKKDVIAWLEKQGEQKTADEVEPKFHKGEWITNGDYTWKIVEVKPLDYILQSQDGNIVDDTISHVDEQFHSFTIQDAKEGDVLYAKGFYGDCVFIFNGLDKWKFDEPSGDRAVATGHCCITISSKNIEFGTQGPDCVEVDTVNPATKEQRDLLFKKMKESGYDFDFETKELKKIDTYCQENCKGFQETGRCFCDGDCKAKKDYIKHKDKQKQDVNVQINPSEYVNDMGGNGCYLKNATQTSTWSKKEEKVDNQNCVKSVDDIKPKFKVGDWISNDMCDAHIASIENGMYYFDEGDGLSIVFVDEHYHLWTIEDAMDGDVLFHSDSASNGIFIFKEIIDKGFAKEVISYCDYDSEDHFCLGEDHTCCWSDAKILYPATKEQRDLLFQKMKEAGYEWDSKKKELKIIDWSKHIKYESNSPSIIEENTEWSDEDERNIQNIDAVLSYDRKLPEDTCVKLRNFLKTLKERIGWKPSEEQISSLRDVIYSLPHQPVLFTLYNDLKKLKGE